MRLKDRVAIVVGAGQSPGEGIGNGRATAITFAREGAKVLCVDHNLASAQETVDIIAGKGGQAVAFKADVTREAEIEAMVADAQARWGRIDILHNNVGVSLSGGDAELMFLRMRKPHGSECGTPKPVKAGICRHPYALPVNQHLPDRIGA